MVTFPTSLAALPSKGPNHLLTASLMTFQQLHNHATQELGKVQDQHQLTGGGIIKSKTL